MKKLYKDISKIFIILVMAFFTFGESAYSKTPEARVDFVSGKAFLRTTEGKTVLLKKGDHIYHLSEVNTTVGSLISFSNFYDQQFSLAGSGYIKFFQKILELRAGYLWVESIKSENSEYSIQTPNAKIGYKKGKSILSYDQYGEKSQILATQGNFKFMNIFDNFLETTVSTGEFSFINKDYENGMPRRPTPAGQSTFLKITGLFKNRPKDDFSSTKDRSYKLVNKKDTSKSLLGRLPSSVNKKKNSGQIIYAHRKKPVFGSKEKKIMDSYERKIASLYKKSMAKKVVKKKFSPQYSKKSGVKVQVFGSRKTVKATPKRKLIKKPIRKKRAPASVSELSAQVKIEESSFESTLLKEYKNQRRHSKETNRLIEDLKSFDQDYKQSY